MGQLEQAVTSKLVISYSQIDPSELRQDFWLFLPKNKREYQLTSFSSSSPSFLTFSIFLEEPALDFLPFFAGIFLLSLLKLRSLGRDTEVELLYEPAVKLLLAEAILNPVSGLES